MTVTNLTTLCDSHVVELKFVRRNKAVSPSVRRMLCTRDEILLNSALSKKIFNFTPPTMPHPYDAASKGLVTVYDLLMLNWRNIPANVCEVIMAVPSRPEKRFWEFFEKKLKNMSSLQKESFMLDQSKSSYGVKPTGQKFYQVRNERGQFYNINNLVRPPQQTQIKQSYKA